MEDGVVIICVWLGTVQYWWISIGLLIVQLRAVFCPSVQYLWFFYEAFSWMILDRSRIPLFPSYQVFLELVYPLTVVLLLIFLNLTTLFSYPVFSCLFHVPLVIVGHFLVFLRSFRFKSFLSRFSPFVAQITNIQQRPRVFSSDDICQWSHWLFQSLLSRCKMMSQQSSDIIWHWDRQISKRFYILNKIWDFLLGGYFVFPGTL